MKLKKYSNKNSSNVKISKFLSYVLRHKPEAIGLKLDANGWVSIKELIVCANKAGKHLSESQLQEVVKTNNKKRFAISEDERMIRASQGHTIDIDLNLKPTKPPDKLYHGTATRFLDSILESGLVAKNRQHVHLSIDYETAVAVGQRHGKPVVLMIKSGKMFNDGYQFYVSDNGVWLTSTVPLQFIDVKN